MLIERGEIAESTIKGLAAAYGNIGYMGPGLALLVFGQEAAVPVALIFCFENIMHFAVAPMMMALVGRRQDARRGSLPGRRAQDRRCTRSSSPPRSASPRPICSYGRRCRSSGCSNICRAAAAPCALFAMGVTLALRPLKRVPSELGPIALLKLIVHPLLCYVVLSWVGDFSPVWLFSAVLLAALPTATNVFVIAQQYRRLGASGRRRASCSPPASRSPP